MLFVVLGETLNMSAYDDASLVWCLHPMSSRSIGSRFGLLHGVCVVVTRPVGEGRALTNKARAAGARPLGLPGLSLRATNDMAVMREHLREVAATAQVAIFTSPAAVRFAFRLLPTIPLQPGTQVFVPGAGTQRALARHGLRATAPPQRSDSEGLLALPGLADVRGQSIVLIGAAGGRELIAPTLRTRGATVESIDVYERLPPRLTQHHFDALAQASDPLIMLVSSGAALAHLVRLLPAPLLARLRRQPLVLSSARLAAFAHEQGFVQTLVASSALADDLLDAAAKVLARHRL